MKAEELGRKLFDALDLPRDAITAMPQITLEGRRRFRLENHQGVLEYGPECLRVRTRCGPLRVEGSKLWLRVLSADMLILEGDIERAAYEALEGDSPCK